VNYGNSIPESEIYTFTGLGQTVKVRVLPKNLKEALRRSGLSEEMFYDAIKAARAAGFTGQSSVNNVGLLLLEAVSEMNPKEELGGYTEVLLGSSAPSFFPHNLFKFL